MSGGIGRRTGAAMAAGFLLLAPAARAETPAPPPHDEGLTVIHLADSAERTLKRDRLRAYLAVDATGPDPRRVQADINRRMMTALDHAKAVASVKPETGGYSVYEEKPDKGPSRWHGSQALILTGKDPGELLGLVGELQNDGLLVRNLAFDLAPETARGIEDELTSEALERLHQRADKVAQSLGMSVARFREIRVGNVGGNVRPPPVPMDSFARAAAAAPPVAEPGESTVRVQVEADILLAPAEANRP
jgi:predicted secreted protein